MTVKTANFRGDIYKNDKNAELRCGPAPIGTLLYINKFRAYNLNTSKIPVLMNGTYINGCIVPYFIDTTSAVT